MQRRDDPNLQNYYRNYRNYLSKLIKTVKYDYYKNQIAEHQNNIKRIYQLVNNITGNSNNKNRKIKILNNDNEEFANDLEMSNYCNKYFTNVGIELEKKINIPPQPLQLNLNTTTNVSMYLLETNNK